MLPRVSPLLFLLFIATALSLHAESARFATPPAVTKPVDDRLRFIGRGAAAAQIPALLRSQPDLRTLKNAVGDNALAYALAVGTAPDTRFDTIQALLAAGFDPRTTTVDGEPALLELFRFQPDKNLPIIKLLLRYGADLKVTDSRGRNALMRYSEYGHDPAVITSLLARGFDVNAKSSDNDCALDLALYSKWVEGVRTLLDAGADYNLTNETLALAGRQFDIPSLKLLYDRGLKQDRNGGTALYHAIRCWNYLDNKYRAAPDKTKLDASVRHEREKGRAAILAFINYAPDTVSLEHNSGMTALSLTADMDIAMALMAAGADPQAPRKPKSHFTSPLGTASEKSLELTRYYIERGLDINSLEDGSTPLLHALRYEGNIEIVHYLLAHGADPKIRADSNIKACIDYSRPDLLRVLIAAGLSVTGDYTNAFSSPLTWAVEKKDPAMVKLLLELGSNPFEPLFAHRTVIDYVRDTEKFQTNTPETKEIFELLTALKDPRKP